MTTPAEHAATVRDAILFECEGADCGECKSCKAWASLAALLDLAERAEQAQRALREILGYAENNDEQSVNARFDAIHSIARAALDGGTATPQTGEDLIAAERQRQVDAEGWDAYHDDIEHQSGELAAAAVCYAQHPFSDARRGSFQDVPGTIVPKGWPWDTEWWKPTPRDRIRELTKAGALIAAELDRLRRSDGGTATPEPDA